MAVVTGVLLDHVEQDPAKAEVALRVPGRLDRERLEPVASQGGLDDLSVGRARQTGEPFSLRWILLHLIEEYARHNGHADLIRESVDGSTGE